MDVFRLTSQSPAIEDVPDPKRVRLPLCGAGVTVKTGEAVTAGQRVAVAAAPLAGDVHASISGVVSAIDGVHLTIDAAEGNGKAPELRGEVTGSDAAALRRGLAAMGVPCKDLEDADLVIVNAMEPEPGVTAFGALCRLEIPAMIAGARLVQRIVEPSRIVLVTPRGSGLSLGPNPLHEMEPGYPGGLDPLVARAVTGKERPGSTVVIGADRLWRIGRAALEGKAVTRTVLTVGGRNLRVAVGTPVRHVLAHAGIEVHEGDRVLLGGPLRGEAVWDLDAPVPREAWALTVIVRAAGATYTDEACMNCGECHLVCPARLLVGIMARFAEFNHWVGAQTYDIDSCMECGLCSYVCPARRPLLQFIRLAKRELAKATDLEPIIAPDAGKAAPEAQEEAAS